MLGGELGETGCLCWKARACHLEASHFTQRLFLSYRQLRIRYLNSFLHSPHPPKSRIHRFRGRGVTSSFGQDRWKLITKDSFRPLFTQKQRLWSVYSKVRFPAFPRPPSYSFLLVSLKPCRPPRGCGMSLDLRPLLWELHILGMYEEPTSIHGCSLLLY